MSRRAQSLPPEEKVSTARGRCVSVLCFSWKFFTCVFSHVTLVTLVVAYCILGAFTFERLESDNERTVKKGIQFIRGNVTEKIWVMTDGTQVLHQGNWTSSVVALLQAFETEILTEMKQKGWDGNEDENQLQWTFPGALFYSIIVITTIGYGHIAPKTPMGKVTTIFYAILGIPLMLLCLSNIGDIMASSFRFIYWRVCCFACTRESKKSKRHRALLRQSRYSSRSQVTLRRSMRISQRSADSGIDPYYETTLTHSYSDTELRYNSLAEHSQYASLKDRSMLQEPESLKDRTYSSRRNRNPRGRRESDRHTVERDRPHKFNKFAEEDPDGDQSPTRKFNYPESRNTSDRFRGPNRRSDISRYSDITPAGRSVSVPRSPGYRAESLDPRNKNKDEFPVGKDDVRKTPILCNKYAIDVLDEPNVLNEPNNRTIQKRLPLSIRSQSLPRSQKRLQPNPSPPNREFFDIEDNDIELQPVKRKRRERSDPMASSPRIMSPMGIIVNRQPRHAPHSRDTESYEEDWDGIPKQRPVPIWLCVFLVVGYILAGASVFSNWEEWSFLDSAYFCFITLTTIGFGDFVPAQGVKENSEMTIALCSLYLLFGIALLAMSFNLVQEEVIANVKSVARRLGILKEEEEVED